MAAANTTPPLNNQTQTRWVDAQGYVVAPPQPPRSFPYPPPQNLPAASAPPLPLPHLLTTANLPPAAAAWAAMAPEERTMRLWQRVSPGMMPGAGAATPKSTNQELHAPPALVNGGVEKVDATHHLRRTDFAECVFGCVCRHFFYLRCVCKRHPQTNSQPRLCPPHAHAHSYVEARARLRAAAKRAGAS